MFGHKHYVPLLKTKKGERWAIRHLSSATKMMMTPLFELHPPKGDLQEHLGKVCASLASDWGTSPCFLDTCWLDSSSGNAQILLDTFTAARTARLNAIPVCRITYPQAALDAIATIHATDARGYLLRLPSANAASHPAINGVVSYMSIPRGDVHLLLDYHGHSMSLPRDVTALPNLDDWMTFSAASGVFPEALGSIPRDIWVPQPRHCWTTWESAVTTTALRRKPAFADYGTRSPGRGAEFGNPPTNIKYAKDHEWFVQMRGRLQHGLAEDMYDIAASLVNQTFYDGPTFSEGDRVFRDLAARVMGPGGGTEWLQWSLNHHLVFTVTQLQSMP